MLTGHAREQHRNAFEELSELNSGMTSPEQLSSEPDTESDLNLDTAKDDPMQRFDKHNTAWQELQKERKKEKRNKLLTKQQAAELDANRERKQQKRECMYLLLF